MAWTDARKLADFDAFAAHNAALPELQAALPRILELILGALPLLRMASDAAMRQHCAVASIGCPTCTKPALHCMHADADACRGRFGIAAPRVLCSLILLPLFETSCLSPAGARPEALQQLPALRQAPGLQGIVMKACIDQRVEDVCKLQPVEAGQLVRDIHAHTEHALVEKVQRAIEGRTSKWPYRPQDEEVRALDTARLQLACAVLIAAAPLAWADEAVAAFTSLWRAACQVPNMLILNFRQCMR